MGQLSESEEKYLRLSETADLWQPKWNENQTVLAAAIHTLDRDEGPLEGAARLGAGVWGVWSEPRAMAAVDCRETDRGEVREETDGKCP